MSRMAFHKIRAYFTGFKYEPDPQPEMDEPQQDGSSDPLQSIVETIVREKAEQAPEDQATTAEGDMTFTDLIEQHEEEAMSTPDPLPSVLDGFQAPGGEVEFAGIPVDRLTGDEEGEELDNQSPDQPQEDQLQEDQSQEGQPDEEMSGIGQAGDSLGRALQGQPEEADRLGLDSLFGQPQPPAGEPQVPEGDSATSGMFGNEPGYEDLVGQALSGPSEAPAGSDGDLTDQTPSALEDEPELLDEVEDLLPDGVEDISGPIDRGDHNFLKTLLLAEEREAEAAVRRVLAASDVTININIGEGGEVDINEEGLESDELEGLGDELEGDELGGEEGLGDELGGEEGLGDELGGEEGLGDGLGDELGEEELPELESSREADAIVRKVLASDVTININIGDDEETLDDEPLDFEPPEEPEEFGEEPEFGEGLDEELEGEEGLGEELGGSAKKGENETFDELDDVGDVFGEGEPVGDKDDEISDFGV